ncbi:MAG: GNAT family N-acetyltransferase [Candidatus Dormibacteraceae bacterium]
MRIRRIDDAAALKDALRVYGHEVTPLGAARLLTNPTCHVLVAYSEDRDELGTSGTPIGVVLATEVTARDLSVEMHIAWTAVQPIFRRLGVGSALVRAMLKLSRERGCALVRATIPPENQGGIHLMRAMGAAQEDVSINVSWEFAPLSEL